MSARAVAEDAINVEPIAATNLAAPAPRRPALRYHGGKWRIAPWIIEHFPAHRVYVEPFGGAASVLLRKPRAYAEIYNDLDDDVVAFFEVLRDPARAAELERRIALIERRPAAQVIAREDRPDTLVYVDPPYVFATRSQKRVRGDLYHGYRHELDDDGHRALLAQLGGAAAMVVLSGYATDLYDRALPGWTRVERDTFADRGEARTEVLWINPRAAAARAAERESARMPLFAGADDHFHMGGFDECSN